MALFKCKMCGGALEINNNETVAICEYCGTQQTLPRLDNDRRANLYDRANHFRRNNEFDKAMGIYEQILNEDNTDAEAYWSLVLCRYGIEYVEDPSSHKRIPTVNRAQFTSIFDDDNYKSALQYADDYQKSIYEEEAKAINEIQKGILAISQKEEPFDVFVCYKESDNGGRRTPDSVLAQDLYYQLTQEGFKVFFARITLEDKLGSAYEPYIFAALNSAKVMVVLGTKPEFFNAVWVKNEWSRYLALIKQGQKKMLIPAYKDMDPYDLPEEFSHLQAQDMSKLGFMQDLIRGIKKIVQADKPVTEVKVTAAQSNAGALVKRAAIFLEDGNVESANDYCEKALDADPECADAYIVKLLIDLGIRSRDELKNCAEPFDNNANYHKAVRFGDDVLLSELNECLESIRSRNEHARIDGIYTSAVAQMATAKYESSFLQLAQQLESIADYQDASALAQQCREKAEDARKDAILAEGRAYMAKRIESVADFEAAIKEFQKISGWKDADDQIVACEKKIEELNAKAEADRLERERQAEIARQEAEKRAKRNKKITIITSSAVAACIALVILWTTVLSPMIQYNKAQTLLDGGSYDEAIAIFTELENYKDSPDKVLETKYAKAENLFASKDYDASMAIFTELADYNDSAERVKEVNYAKAGALVESGDYANAADIYKALGEYKDSATLYPATVLNYATALVEKKDLAGAEKQLSILAKYDAYAEDTNALYVRVMDAYYADGKYNEALSAYKNTKDYNEDSDKYKDMTYKYAQSLFDQKNYSTAKSTFKKISGYSDADQKAIECDYQQGLYELSKKNYSGAINAFERVKDYSDSKEQIKEAKYQYVKANKSRTDTTTYTYLKDLKSAKYKDSADIFKELYAWKLEVVAVNSDPDDEKTNKTSISVYDPVFFHFKVTGGEPGAETTLKVKRYMPSGETGWYTFTWDVYNGAESWYGWENGVYTNPAYGTRGTLKVEFYDEDGNKIGEGTVRLTS
ncbi:MAG: TIR domain-containing protein [Oscillospiraceae bacterium]|nr:TIR domain-containing protein [Oscillospiraceae bacterium]